MFLSIKLNVLLIMPKTLSAVFTALMYWLLHFKSFHKITQRSHSSVSSSRNLPFISYFVPILNLICIDLHMSTLKSFSHSWDHLHLAILETIYIDFVVTSIFMLITRTLSMSSDCIYIIYSSVIHDMIIHNACLNYWMFKSP